MLIRMVFVITWEIFHGRISLNSAFLLLLANFLGGFRLKLMYISLNVSTTSSLTHLYGFQLLVLLPQFTEITFFVCINRINLMNLNESSGRLIVVAKGFLQLPNLHMLLKQLSLSLPRNLALGMFFKLPIMFSPKVNLQYLLNSAAVDAILCIWESKIVC